MKNTENRILRWDKKKHTKYGAENKGKWITDNNPYININPESFDRYTEIDPPNPNTKLALDPKKMRKFLRDKQTPKLGRAFVQYIPGLFTGSMLEKTQKIKNNKVKTKKYETLKEKLKLKEEILEELRANELIGGFTLIDRRYINEEKEHIFPYDTFLIIGMEMTKDTIMEIPQPTTDSGKIFDFDVYHDGGLIVDKLADFIRRKGVKCFSHIPLKWDINFAPHAINAGIGNYSTHGLVLTKEWGTRLRFFAISIELDIPIDRPKDYNFEEFCKKCRMCYKACPTNAIPKEAYDYRGAVKRRVSIKRCGVGMSENKFCGVCLKVCPFNNFGYEKCMDTLPEYYKYNLMDNETGSYDKYEEAGD
jgi:ferredoxin